MSVQLVIIALYFILTVIVGLRSSSKTKNSAAFHGVAMGVTAIVFTSATEWLGGTSTTGVSEYGFIYGLSGAWFTIANGIGVMFLAFFFAELFRGIGSITIPGIIEKFLGVKARVTSSMLLTVVMLAVGLSQMIAAGKLGQSLMGFDFNLTVVVFAVIFIVYTLAGGMKSVASTNMMHLSFMYGSIILAVVFTGIKMGGWSSFTAGIASVELAEGGSSYFNMFSIGMPKVSSWIIASILGACTAQAGLQPVLASKDIPTAKKSCILTAFVIAPFGILTALLGMAAKVMSHRQILLDTNGINVTDGKLALPTLMMNLPPIVGGIVLAAILAAVISTVSPIILSAGTMLTKDLYQRVYKPNASDAEVLKISRITTALSGVICSAAAIGLADATKVLDIVYSAYSLRGALFVVLLLGIYWKKTSEMGACWSMVLTGVASVGCVAFKIATGRYPISDALTETYVAVIVAFVGTVAFSLLLPNSRNKQKF